jgi:plasmid stabilization system protein ParE
MTFTVIWVTSAENELIKICLDAADRQTVAASAAEIDQRLRARPEQEGESRSGDRRILIVPPLAVIYRVRLDDRIVRVLQTWRIDVS